MSILLDAGPSLNFLAVGQQNILIQIAQSQKLRLAAPARVDSEVIGMSRSDRFKNTRVRTHLEHAEELRSRRNPPR